MSNKRIISGLKASLILLLILTSFTFLNNNKLFNKSYDFQGIHSNNDTNLTYEEKNPYYTFNENSYPNNETIVKTDVEFNHYNSCDSRTEQIIINDCDDWGTNSTLNFSDIRRETITNGNAETSDVLFTDYIPSHYDGNITREDNIRNGEAITGDYSWYFDIKSQDHTTIAGFDTPINFSSHSVIFSLSYSLLDNSLGTFYDSNICIRLFFQFDIYIFIWFNGNTGVLSNVTGPGGYADILVNEASFDGEINQYSLNITSLGLELFDQEPDQLRSFAVQTWGATSYDMAFSFDDISLTDMITPSEAGLTVNSVPVIGAKGSGSIKIVSNPIPMLSLTIQDTFSNLIYWNCDYLIKGYNSINDYRNLFFNDYSEISWIDTLNFSLDAPSICNEIIFSKWIPEDWVIDDIRFNDLSVFYDVQDSNGTHKNIKVIIPYSTEELQCFFTSSNYIHNVILSNYEISHDDMLSVFIQSQLFFEVLEIYIVDKSNNQVFSNTTVTDAIGEATLGNIIMESWYDRGNYSVLVMWQSETQAGLGSVFFEINTIPTEINPENAYISTNYFQEIDICVDFVNLENNLTINQATLTYTCEFSSGSLLQNGFNQYVSKIQTEGVDPGNYSIIITGEKNGYATAYSTIIVEINVSSLILDLIIPPTAGLGDTITPLAKVMDNLSNPMFNVSILFRVNNQLNSETWTNTSGYATMYYSIPISYEFDNLNISCSILIDHIEYYLLKKSILIEIFDLDRLVQLENPIHLNTITQDDSNYLYFSIRYPSIGEKWFAHIPDGFIAKTAKIISDIGNLTAVISPTGNIYWDKIVSNSDIVTDYLLLEIESVEPLIVVDFSNKEVNIEIKIITNYIPFDGLPIIISLQNEWSSFNKWNLYLNGTSVNEEFNLRIESDYISFDLYTTENTEEVILNLSGTKGSLISIAPSTIILGVGILILTVISTILLSKRKTNTNPDFQI